MIRDRGHALSIQIDISDQDNIYVDYYIPKICNIDMVNSLKGVRKVDEHSMFTNGCFQTNINNLNIELFKFISMVPTDLDMNFNKLHGKYTGFVAEIIQHEIDHTNGIII